MKTFIEWVQNTHPEYKLDEGVLDAAKATGRGLLKGGQYLSNKVSQIALAAIYAPYKTLSHNYGSPAALAIMAASLGLHAMFPALAALPASILIGAAPGILAADAIKFLKGKETLIGQGVQELKKLDKAKLLNLFKKTREDVQQQPKHMELPA